MINQENIKNYRQEVKIFLLAYRIIVLIHHIIRKYIAFLLVVFNPGVVRMKTHDYTKMLSKKLIEFNRVSGKRFGAVFLYYLSNKQGRELFTVRQVFIESFGNLYNLVGGTFFAGHYQCYAYILGIT